MKYLLRHLRWRSPLLFALLWLSHLGVEHRAIAQTQPLQPPFGPPLDLTPLQPGAPVPANVVTANTISQTGLTIPSLWWAREQFGGKLVDNWLAYPGTAQTPARVDLIINRQLWSLLDYLDRYQFVHHFGQVAKDYGYNIRVFNRQKTLLAAYTCNFSIAADQCSIWLDSNGLQTAPTSPFGN